MPAAPAQPRRVALAVALALVMAGAVWYGYRLETTTQLKPPPVPKAASVAVAGATAPASAPASAPDLASVSAPATTSGTATANQESLATALPPASTLSDPEMMQLRSRALTLPVQGVNAAQLVDTYTQARAAGAPHEAIDILAERGTPVLAVEDGEVVKLFFSKAGGITLYQFDPGRQYAYYYAHLDRYAEGVGEGSKLRKGQVIGFVGSTGNALPGAPHLHFAIFVLGPERQWWRGTPVNPFLVWRDAKN